MNWFKRGSQKAVYSPPNRTLDPNYVSPEKYAEIVEQVHADPPDLSLVSDEELMVLVHLLMERGYFAVGNHGWHGLSGATYFIYKSGSTVMLNYSTDATAFARKAYALSTLKDKLIEMYEREVVQRIRYEVKQMLISEGKLESL